MIIPSPSGYQLTADELELLDNDWSGDFRIEVQGADATFGDAVPVSEVITSLMVDGDLTRTTRYGNRVASFLVTVTGRSPRELADGEELLMTVVDAVSQLTWTVPFAPDTVFDVVRAWPDHEFNPSQEIINGRRTFRLFFECLPHPRSVEPESFVWTGPGRELSSLSSASSGGWSLMSGNAPSTPVNEDDPTGKMFFFNAGAGVMQLAPTVPLDEYLWIKSGSNANPFVGSGRYLKVGGVTVDWSRCREVTVGSRLFMTVPTPTWRGKTPRIELSVPSGAKIDELFAASYPSPVVDAAQNAPRGIGVVDVAGSARTGCRIEFTAPAGGAFVYTAPDPNVAIRKRGAAELVFGRFTVSAADGGTVGVGSSIMWFPQGTHSAQVGATSPRPVDLDGTAGLWPTQASGPASGWGGSGVAAGAYQFAYPIDADAATSFFDTTGAKLLLTASLTLPEGLHSDAVHHEQHALYAGRSGFAVLDKDGKPIPTTVTYYPRWRFHAAR